MNYLISLIAIFITINAVGLVEEKGRLKSHEFIVRLNDKSFSLKELNEAGAKLLKPIAEKVILVRARSCEQGDCLDLDDMARKLRRLNFVQQVEEDFLFHFNYVPNDPHYYNQWFLSADPITQYNVGAVDAWDFTQGSEVIKVGIIDSGVDTKHPELQQNLSINFIEQAGSPGVDDDGNGYVDDIYGYNFAENNSDLTDIKGHGTAIAGIIGGVGNNSLGISGINWYSNLVIAKVSDSKNVIKNSSIIEAFEYLRKQKVKIIQISLGTIRNSWTLNDIIKRATDEGILVVTGAGNHNSNLDRRNYYPAKFYNKSILVACSANIDGKKSKFSNFGSTNVDVCAPGEDIVTTFPDNQYRTYSGTSMAAAFVTGAAALIWSDKPNLSTKEIIGRITEYSDKKLDSSDFSETQGRLNIYNSLLGIHSN